MSEDYLKIYKISVNGATALKQTLFESAFDDEKI